MNPPVGDLAIRLPGAESAARNEFGRPTPAKVRDQVSLALSDGGRSTSQMTRSGSL